jgi:OmpA-OmpF porin, OOP family
MKTKTLTIIFLILTFSIRAQEKGSNIYFNVGGGMQNLLYSTTDATSKGAFGFTLNGGYNYYFGKNLGISLGIGINSFNCSGEWDGLMSSPSVDIEGDNYEHRNYLTLWTEKQSGYFLGLPLGLVYRNHIAKKVGLSATIGVKYLIPVKATYEVTGGNLVSTGYYSQWNVELENLPQYGFPTLTSKPSGEIKLKSGLSIYTDLGVTFSLAERRSLYLGGYLDYGVTNFANSQENLPFGSKGIYTSIIESSEAVNKIQPLSYGLKIGISLEMKSKSKQ